MNLFRRKIFKMSGSFQKFCYMESPGAIATIVIDRLNDFIHNEEKRARRKTVVLS